MKAHVTPAPATAISEADLCAAFIGAATKLGCPDDPRWVAYPETAGFDILLVRQSDGAQIGVEAKLALNPHVVVQALPEQRTWSSGITGPDYRAVLVPSEKSQNYLAPICAALGITVIRFHTKQPKYGAWGSPFTPRLPRESHWGGDAGDWHEWAPLNRCAVPDYIPDVAAGISAPVSLTAWKVKAIRLAILLEDGPVTRADFKHLQLSATHWTCPGGWLDRTPAGYIAGPRTPDFRVQHPRNYEEIKADKARWEPKLLTPRRLAEASASPIGRLV